MAKQAGQKLADPEIAIAERIGRFANVLSSSVFARSMHDLEPVMSEVDDLLSSACILERLVFTRNVLNTPGVPRTLIDRLLADNFLVARMLMRAGYGLDDDRTIRLLSTRDEAFQIDIASHAGLSERITDYLVEIGGPEVAYRLADNKRARLSPMAVTALVERAQTDHRLLHALANRRSFDGGDVEAELDETRQSTGLGARAPEPAGAAGGSSPPKRLLRREKIINHN